MSQVSETIENYISNLSKIHLKFQERIKQIEEKYDLTKDDDEMIACIYNQINSIFIRYLEYFMKNHIKEPIKEDDE